MYHSNWDRMPVTHARQLTGRLNGELREPITADEWVQYGGFREDYSQLVRDANKILDSITPAQAELLKRAVKDRSIDMNALQCEIRDQAIG